MLLPNLGCPLAGANLSQAGRKSVPGRPTRGPLRWDVPPDIGTLGRPSHPPQKVWDSNIVTSNLARAAKSTVPSY